MPFGLVTVGDSLTREAHHQHHSVCVSDLACRCRGVSAGIEDDIQARCQGIQGAHQVGSITEVISLHVLRGVRVPPRQQHALHRVRRKRKRSIIFEQDETLLCRVTGQRLVRLGVDHRHVVLAPGHEGWRVSKAQSQLHAKEVLQGTLREFFPSVCLVLDQRQHHRVPEEGAAVRVHAGAQRRPRSFVRSGRVMVQIHHVVDRPAVGRDVPVQAPFVPCQVGEDLLVRTAGDGTALCSVPIQTVSVCLGIVAAHHAGSLAHGHTRLEGWKVRVLHVTRCNHGRKRVAACLLGVGREVLQASCSLQILRIFALHATDVLLRVLAVDVGVLAGSFLAAAPTRISKDVDVRCPEGETLVSRAKQVVVLPAALSRNSCGHLPPQGAIETTCHTDDLRKGGGQAVTRNAVQSLRPPIVAWPSNAVDGGCLVHEEGRLLLR
mmetsp:Transcript_53219/g.142358  ORF Transcript_53219/g.142358 Transcript_53219/m.142358 type:complete len:435 (+) Transcript_53219:1031-2335(+)